MATIVIKSKSAKRLKALSEFAKQMDFEVSVETKPSAANDAVKKGFKNLPVTWRDSSVDPNEIIGTLKGYTKQSLRERAWKKRK